MIAEDAHCNSFVYEPSGATFPFPVMMTTIFGLFVPRPIHRSMLGAFSDIYAILWVFQWHLLCRFTMNGDCLCPLSTANSIHSWSAEPVSLLIAALMNALVDVKQVQLAHAKSHDGHPWNQAADAIAKMCASQFCVGSDDSTANVFLANCLIRPLLSGFGYVR